MATDVHVSAYDVTKGVPFYNLTSRPNPRIVGGTPSWTMAGVNNTQPMTSQVVAATGLLAATGVAPRRAGNTYAVSTITGANPGPGPGDVLHCPLADYISNQPNQTVVMSKWVYIKTAGTPVVRYGMGVGFYDANFNNSGGYGDTSGPVVPVNQWVRISETFTLSVGPAFFNCVLTVTSDDFVSGNIIISTDWMVNTGGSLVDYFDGNYPAIPNPGGDTKFAWTDVPWASSSTKTTSMYEGLQLFPPDNIKSYSVNEQAMSLDPADYSGGYGTITFEIDDVMDVRLLKGKTFELSDTDKGKTTGIVTSMEGSLSGVQVTTDSMLGVLNSWRTLTPFNGTLAQYISYVFDLVGLKLPVVYEGSVGSKTVVARAYVGNLWDWMKQLLSAKQVEMALVYNTVTFRPFRTYEAYTGRASDASWSIGSTETAKAVEVTYYNNVYGSGEIYPLSYAKDADTTIMQAGAGETVDYVIQLSSTPSYISEPYAVYTVANEPQITSRYAVSGNDDLPIQPTQWNSAGGDLTVKVSPDDPTQVIVTVKGANIPSLAPFRIAMSSGSGNYYNSLHLTGNAVRFTPETVVIPTGASSDITGTEVGITVTNPFISSKEEAFRLGMYTAASYTGFNYTVSGSAWDINRAGYSGGVYAAIRDFNNSWPIGTETIANFNSRYAGILISQFNTQWDESIEDTYRVQAFGNAAGARVKNDYAYFRIDDATFNETDVTYTASIDTTIADFNSTWSDAPAISDFNFDQYQRLLRDFSIAPLWRV